MIDRVVRLFVGELPVWARRDHPALRAQLVDAPRGAWQVRYARAFGVIVLGVLLLFSGYLIAATTLSQPAGQTTDEAVNAVFYVPLILLQTFASIAALTSVWGFAGVALRNQQWDSLRATEQGVEVAMRARWASVFYRLRGLLGVILLARVALIGLMLWALTSFQGRYLDLLTDGITPNVPLIAAVLLTALFMTAALLLPVTSLSLDAAFGLLFGVWIKGRTFSTLLQAVLILLRVGVMLELLVGAFQVYSGDLPATDLGAWLLLGGAGALGDGGLSLLYLGRANQAWSLVPYGIFLGLALVIFALAQMAAAERVLLLAARQAQKHG